MRNNYLPSGNSECRHLGNELCTGELSYYKEGSMGLDLYYCQKCYKIAEWNGKDIRGTEIEAYPNRDK
jgi:hypothetical protein